MNVDDVRVILTTTARAEAAALARSLIESRLVACANIIPSIVSHYRWNGRIEEANEAMLILKTPRVLADRVVDAIRHEHTFTNPEILVLPVEGGSELYARWVHDETVGLAGNDSSS